MFQLIQIVWPLKDSSRIEKTFLIMPKNKKSRLSQNIKLDYSFIYKIRKNSNFNHKSRWVLKIGFILSLFVQLSS